LNRRHRPHRSWLGTLPPSERRLVVLNRRTSARLDLHVPLGTLLARHTRLGHRDVNNVTRLQLAPHHLGRLTDGDLTTLVSDSVLQLSVNVQSEHPLFTRLAGLGGQHGFALVGLLAHLGRHHRAAHVLSLLGELQPRAAGLLNLLVDLVKHGQILSRATSCRTLASFELAGTLPCRHLWALPNRLPIRGAHPLTPSRAGRTDTTSAMRPLWSPTAPRVYITRTRHPCATASVMMRLAPCGICSGVAGRHSTSGGGHSSGRFTHCRSGMRVTAPP